jgi:putative proteasome-type protease
MTYCLAASVRDGMIFVSDSRTNAGADQLSTFSKMHAFCGNGQRFFVLLTAGNLATTQAVVAQIRRDMRDNAKLNLSSVTSMAEAAEYVGDMSRLNQAKHASKNNQGGFNPEASFILGGQIQGSPQRLYLIYPEGNFVHTTARTPYLQIGEIKYGKPILDRIINDETDLEMAMRCAIVSMDSTIRSNGTVGPPVEALIYRVGTQVVGDRYVFEEDSEYLSAIRVAWQNSLQKAFEELPKLNVEKSSIRLVDG